jgi:hypothetical protein
MMSLTVRDEARRSELGGWWTQPFTASEPMHTRICSVVASMNRAEEQSLGTKMAVDCEKWPEPVRHDET